MDNKLEKNLNNKLAKYQERLKENTIALLIKYGNNPKDVEDMVNKHFDYAASKYQTASKIANVIRTIY